VVYHRHYPAKKTQPGPAQLQQVHSLETGLIKFTINWELLYPSIDTVFNTITVTIPDSVSEHNLTANFTLASQVSATVNSSSVNNSFVYDFSKPVNFTVTSADKKRSTTFQVIAQTELRYFGFTGNISSAKSLNKDYNFYFDQIDGSTFGSVNCGPAASVIAIKWADSTFTKTPSYARSQLLPQGGDWSTGDVQIYLNSNGISNTIDTLRNLDSLVKATINNNQLIILCLDMWAVPQNMIDYQYVQKFGASLSIPDGHFLLVKGYKQFDDNTFYLEVYDPYSNGERYSGLDNGQLKGIDRCYQSDYIQSGTGSWWPYAIIIASKGRQVIASAKTKILTLKKPIPMAFGR
jgi:hypothetical protein